MSESTSIQRFKERISQLPPEKLRMLQEKLRERMSDTAPASPTRTRYALTPFQRRIYTLQQMDPRATAYNLPIAYRLSGAVNGGMLQRAVQGLVDRHDALRARFAIEGDEIVQVIQEKAAVSVSIDSCSRADLKDRLPRLVRPFDLARGPLLRVHQLKLADAESILFLDIHHICADEVSLHTLVSDLADLYSGVEARSTEQGFSSYLAWSEKDARSAAWRRQERYWLGRMAGEVPTLDLPTDFTRPSGLSFRGDRLTFNFEAGLASDLSDLCGRQGVTPHMLCLALYKTFLAIYGDFRDLVVGIPVSNRREARWERTVGVFLNTLPIRTRPSPQKRFCDYLAEVREATLDGLENQSYPFDLLVEKTVGTRTLNRNPLFETLFLYRENAPIEVRMQGIEAEPFEIATQTSKFDLTFEASVDEGRLCGAFEYNADLFKRETIEAMGRYLGCLTERIVQDPLQPIGALGFLPSSESLRLREDFNATDRALPPASTIHQAFEAKVGEMPDRIALAEERRALSYSALNAQANRLAWRIAQQGSRSEEVIGVLCDRSSHTVVAMLAALKAGCAYLPLDAGFPRERIEHMLDHSRVRLVLTGGRAGTVLPSRCIRIDLDDPGLLRGRGDDLPSPADGDNLAYVIYTSGSTGTPKGVMITHRNVLNFCRGIDESVGVSGHGAIAASTTISFDIFVLESLIPLLLGLRVSIVEEQVKQDPAGFFQFLSNAQVDLVQATPSFYRYLLQQDPPDGSLAGLDKVLIGGEALPAEVLQAVRRQTNAPCFNLYGPTETTIWSAVCQLEGSRVEIGRPLANTRIFILDREGRLRPPGLPGSLMIAGLGLARGYFAAPDLTAERFLPDPFAAGERIYDTGDLARWTPDGSLVFEGRRDFQVKVRGFRVEVGEIEHRLEEIPGVRQAIVVAVDEGSQYRDYAGSSLSAFVLAQGRFESEQWRARLSQVLPDYMIPSRLAVLDSFPVTPNGKTDRKALRRMRGADPARRRIPPRDAFDALLAAIWQKVLEVDALGIDDDFFALGGHSLKAISLCAEIERTLGRRVSASDFFRKPTIRAVSDGLKVREASGRRPPTAVEERPYYPLSSQQRRLYALQQLDPDSTAYNMPRIFRFAEPVRAQRIAAVLEQLIRRHEALRTSFRLVGERLVQVVAQDVENPLERLESTPEGVPALISDLVRPFSPESPSLLRACLIETGGEASCLFIDVHHIVGDAVSLDLLLREFELLLKGNDLSLLSLQYRDYAVWQQEGAGKGVTEEQSRFWLDEFATQPPQLELPLDSPRPPVFSFRGGRHGFALDPAATEGAVGLASDCGVTLFVVGLAAFKILLSRICRESDLVVGTPVVGRDLPGLESVAGMFVNTLALRSRPLGGKTVAAYVAELRDLVISALDHQQYPFEDLVSALALPRETSRNPLFDVSFEAVWADEEAADPGSPDLSPDLLETGTCKFDLTLRWIIRGRQVECEFEYAADLFQPATIERFGLQYRQVLERMRVANQPIAAVDVVTEGERRWLLEHSRPSWELPQEGTALERIEGALWSRPDAAALRLEEGSVVSCGELLRLAGRAAFQLRRRGAGAGSRVGLLMGRGPWLAAAALGCWKAGAAYVPLDPSHPPARLGLMLRDSGAELLVHDAACAELAGELGGGASAEEWLRGPQARRPGGAGAGDPAYVMYTSGSTGRPKGVAVSHGSLWGYLGWAVREYAGEGALSMALYGTAAADLTVTSLYLPLLTGGSVHVCGRDWEGDRPNVSRLLREDRLEGLKGTPSQLGLLLDDLSRARSLRVVISGGEALSEQLAGRIREAAPWARLCNEYGPTEAAVGCMIQEWQGPGEGGGSVAAGRARSGARIVLLDAGGGLTPQGSAGEICIGGGAPAQGYWADGGRTAERFGPDPWGRGGRLYRSGDLGRWRGSALEYLGREDGQVKVRGHRVELGEVEAVLGGHEGVRACAAGLGEGGRLCAWVAGEAEWGRLRELARSRLPEAMVPQRWVRVQSLPLDASGKVDRRLADSGSEAVRSSWSPPRGAEERALCGELERLLSAQRVGLQDDYFALGGDSIQALQLCARLRSRHGLGLQVRDVFEAPRVGELAQRLTRGPGRAEQRADRGDVPWLPIHHWLAERVPEPRGHWNQAVLLQREGRISPAALGRAWEALLERHDGLHLRGAPGRALLRWERVRQWELTTVDLSGQEGGGERIGALSTQAQSGLLLQGGPLFRLCLFRLREGDHLLIAIHHAVVDGVSWRILAEDLESAYAQALAGRGRLRLGPRTHSYRRWSERLGELAEEGSLQGELEHWRRACAPGGLAPPVDCVRRQAGRGAWIERRLESGAAERLRREGRRAYNASLEELLLAALALAAGGWAGAQGEEATLLAELEGHGREEGLTGLDASRTVGWFASRYPVRLPLRLGDLGRQVRESKEALRGTPNRGAGYGILRRLSRLEAEQAEGLRAEPWIGFNYLGEVGSAASGRGGFGWSPHSSGASVSGGSLSPQALSADALLSESGLSLRLSGGTGRERLQELAESWLARLGELADHCAARSERRPTPSDHPLSGLSQQGLDGLMGRLRGRGIAAGQVEAVYPLSPMQSGMLFEGLLQRRSRAYVEQFWLVLRGRLSRSALGWALERLSERHEALRLRLDYEGAGAALQVVLSRGGCGLAAEGEGIEELEQALERERERGFDLQREALLRLRLLSSGGERHVLAATFHHIIMDGWCMGIVFEELMLLYAARLKGEQAQLERSRPYGGYLRWLAGRDREAALEHWRSRLGEADAGGGSLPWSRGAGGGYERAAAVRELEGEVRGRLQRACARAGVTLNSLMQGAWGVLLQRWSDSGEACWGSVISGRPSQVEGVERIVGLFVNTIPVRAVRQEGEGVLQLARRLQERLRRDEAFGYLPLSEVQACAPAGRGLIDHLLVYENYPVDEQVRSGALTRRSGLQVESMGAWEQTSYDFNLLIVPAERLRLRFEFNRLRIEPALVERIAQHFLTLLENLSRQPDALPSQIDILSPAERSQLLADSAPSPAIPPAGDTLPEVFYANSRALASQPALVFRDTVWSRDEFNRRSNQLAWRLRDVGVEPNRLVGIYMQRSPEMVLAIFAVLKAGGAYLPLDPEFPRKRLEFILQESEAQAVLTAHEELPQTTACEGIVQVSLKDDAEYRNRPDEDLPVSCSPSDLAYVLYTSGSTGTPKGVAVEHRQILNTLAYMESAFPLQASDAYLFKTAFTFDVSLTELFGWTFGSGRLVILPLGFERDPAALSRTIERTGVTHINFAPSALKGFIEGCLSHPQPVGLDSLKYVIVAGEAFTPDLLERWRNLNQQAQVENLYGPTEAAIYASRYALREGDENRSAIPIGKAIPGTGVLILDRHQRLQPRGIAGQLHLAGAGLAQGYFKRPELTQQAFVEHPFRPGERLYRTGDLACILEDGNVQYLGRLDHQVKVRGYRIELGEIESHLARHAKIRHAVVESRPDDLGDRSLAAFLVLDYGDEEAGPGDPEGGRVDEWQEVYDEFYSDSRGSDSLENFAGWNSSYTGEPIPEEEMRAWLCDTVESIRLLGARKVLELGCGTGLLLFRLKDACDLYVGTDFSASALDFVRRRMSQAPEGGAEVRLLQRGADDFEGFEERSFDAVVLNSVIQYFPSVRYLVDVIEKAVERVRDGGCVFIGDVRSLSHLEALHVSVALFKASEDVDAEELRARVARRIFDEEELVVDPSLFSLLQKRVGRIVRVRLLQKSCRLANELSKFRYQAILEIGSESDAVPQPPCMAWGEEVRDLAGLRRRLEDPGFEALAVRAIPNARVYREMSMTGSLQNAPRGQSVLELKRDLDNLSDEWIDPSELYRLGDDLGLQAAVSWTSDGRPDRFDAVFAKNAHRPIPFPHAPTRPQELSHLDQEWEDYANNPLQSRVFNKWVPKFRSYLQDRLPPYMIPNHWIPLQQLPMTSSGKVDRAALPGLSGARSGVRRYVEPQSPIERELCKAWEAVLGVSRVGIDDDYFALGGDSIKAIQIASRLRDRGFRMEMRDLFDHRTVRELSLLVTADAVEVEEGPVEGAVDFTPIMHAFAEQRFPQMQHWNQALMLSAPSGIEAAALEACLAGLLDHHDALRLVLEDDGKHRLTYKPSSQLNWSLETIELPSECEIEERILQEANRLQGSIDLLRGPLFKLALFKSSRGDHLFLAMHHLLIDGVSWRILVEDLQEGYGQLVEGKPLRFKRRTHSFKRWSEGLRAYAASRPLKREAEFWRSACDQSVWTPLGAAPEARGAVSQSAAVDLRLAAQDSGRLLKEAHRAYSTEINELLLCAFGLALRDWAGKDAESFAVWVNLEGHGREEAVLGLDVSRTVGWFTTQFPVRLEIDAGHDLDGQIQRTKESLRAIPDKGLGYGVLRYLSDVSAQELEITPWINFNYLGQVESASKGEGWALSALPTGASVGPLNHLWWPLDVSGLFDGERLSFQLRYSPEQWRDSQVEALASRFQRRLEELASFCASRTEKTYTPSDFSLRGWSLPEWACLVEGLSARGIRMESVERIYPLTPMQTGMLFHRLLDDSGQVYVEQMWFLLQGRLDRSLLRRSFDHLVQRHQVLRSTISHSDSEQPLQIVLREWTVPFRETAASGPDRNRSREIAQTLLRQEREDGFELEAEPLIRVLVVEQGPEEFVAALTFHHILMDGWCVGLLFKEWMETYSSLRWGAGVQKRRACRYGRYIEWLQAQDRDVALEYWTQALAPYQQATPVSASMTVGTSKGAATEAEPYRGGVVESYLSSGLKSRLSQLCGQLGATLNSLFQTAWAIVLQRLNRSEEAVFGCVISGRPAQIEGVEEIIGLFVNTIPVAVSTRGDDRFQDLAARVQSRFRESLDYGYLPLNDIQGCSPLGREMIDHLLVFENFPVDEELAQGRLGQGSGVRIKDVGFEERTNYDLNLLIVPGTRTLIKFDYDKRAFETRSVEQLAARLIRVLSQAAASPDVRVSEIDVVTEGERRWLLEHSRPSWELPQEGTALERIEGALWSRPDAAALRLEEGSVVSCGELLRLAGRAAFQLRRRGAGAGSRVGLLMGRGPWLAAAALGCWKAGAAYVPLDPSHPPARLGLMLRDSGAELLVHDAACAELAGELGGGASAEEWLRGPQARRPGGAGAGDPAYVMYTSGSTGRPKGVAVSHGSLWGYLGWAVREYAGEGALSMALYGTAAADLTVTSLYLPLLTGGSVHVCGRDWEGDRPNVSRLLREDRLEGLKGTPSQLGLLLDDLSRARSLRVVISGGEALSEQLAGRIREAAPWARLCNEYGPTEAAVGCMIQEWQGPGEGGGSVAAGRARSGARIVLLDAGGGLTPQGSAGEICIGGGAPAQGYWADGGRTAERFGPDPWGRGGRLYRSGDLGRWRGSALEYLGREDGQVKVRGHRVELGEVEAVLGGHEGVRACAAGLGEGGRLCAWVAGEAEWGRLRELARSRLPEAMVPQRWVRVQSLPLDASGKVDRRLADSGSEAVRSSWSPPRGAEERALCGELERLLSAQRVGLQDDYFALGGDSIQALQLCARLRSRHGLGLQVRDVFEAPRVGELAQRLTRGPGRAEQRADRGDVPWLPIHHWLAERVPEPRGHWNQAVLLQREGRISPAALGRAWEALLERHDGLHLRGAPGRALLRWERVRQWELTTVDLSGQEGGGERIGALSTQAQSGLLLQGGPLFRLCLFRLREGDHLLIAIHHAVVDGVSWRILAEDLESAYAQALAGRGRLRLGPRTHSYRRWSERLGELAEEGSLQGELEHWRRACAPGGLAPPVDCVRRQAGRGAWIERRLESGAAERLRREGRRAYNASLEELLLAALALAAGGWAGAQGEEATLLAELEGHGREEGLTGLDASRTVGWFASRYPVRLPLRLGDLGRQVRESKEALRGTPNRGAGYGILRRLSRLEAEQAEGLRAEPWIGFNYLGEVGSAASGRGGFGWSPHSSGASVSGGSLSPQALSADALLSESGLSLRLSGGTGRERLQELAESWLARLGELADHCAARSERRPTPSDHPLSGLSQQGLDGLMGRLRGRGIAAGQVEAVYPLSPMQSGMLFEGLLQRRSRAYVEQFWLVLRGRLSRSALGWALERLSERHEALRLRLDYEGAGAALQVVLSRGGCGLAAEGEGIEELEQALERERERGFDLQREALLRLRLLSSGGERHVLAATFHHIIMDGWCMGIVFEELMLLYAARLKGEQAQLERSRPYGGYLRWLAGRDREAALEHWRSRLGEADAGGGSLPWSRGAGGGYERAAAVRELEGEVRGRLQRACARAGVTLNSLMQGAWGVLLQRWSDSGEACWGSVISGRPSQVEGVERIVGLFVNTIPVRAVRQEGEGVLQLARRLQERLRRDEAFGYLPLSEVQACAPAGRGLIDHLLVYENYPVDEQVRSGALTRRSGLQVESMGAWEQTSYDFNLLIVPAERLRLRFEFNRLRIEPALVERIAQHFLTLLERLAEDPDQPADEINWSTTEEEAQALLHLHSARADYPRDETIGALFSAQAARTPDRCALEWEGQSLSYRQLELRSNRLAHLLRSRGVSAETPVGLMLERSPDLIASMLAVLKAGGAYVPIEACYPNTRIRRLLEDSRASLVLTRRELRKRLGGYAGEAILLDNDPAADQPASSPPQRTSARCLAYLMYTSGSTGEPKGVAVEHRSVVRLVSNPNYVDFRQGDRVLQTGAATFDAATFEVWGALLNGLTLILPSDDALLAADRFRRIVQQRRITLLWLTSPLFNRLISQDPSILAGVEQVIVGGDVVSSEHVASALEACPGLRAINGYGPTEGTTFSVCGPIQAPCPKDIPIGRPISNTGTVIVNRWGQAALPHCQGELWITGDGLARGYFGRPDLTAERFVPNPFEDSARAYRSGDQARQRADGVIEFLGRMDDQLKIRGFRIEPGEIESALMRFEAVREAAVAAVDPPADEAAGAAPRERFLCAYVSGDDVDPSELRKWLGLHLPDYMIPSRFVKLEALPLKLNGKVDRDRLPAPRPDVEEGFRPPADALERELARIWQRVLSVESVGRSSNFFDLGGHSLHIIEVYGRLKRAFDPDLQVADLFQYPTIEALASKIREGQGESADTPSAGVEHRAELRKARRESARAKREKLKRRKRS